LSVRALAGGVHTWGRLAEYSGDLALAQDLFERSLSASRAHGDRRGLARALCALGDVAVHHGLLDEARDRYLQALELAEQEGAEPELAQSLLSLGRVDATRGEVEQSTAWLEKALSAQRRAGDPWGVAFALNELGQQARRAGQLAKAQSLLEECHVLWHQTGTLMGERAALMNLTLVVLELGHVARAAGLARESILRSDAMHDDASAAAVRCVEIAALVLGARDSTDTAVSLVASATRRREILGAPRPPAEEAELRPLLAHAAAALGVEAFDTAWALGLGVQIHEALALARATLEWPSDRVRPLRVWDSSAAGNSFGARRL
jgi:tetratricopeptide (TPR) repeat protein